MSDFSSWGVPETLELKPEITAPGGNIYSVNGAVAGGKSYETMSGTSMAAPQMAGMAAVMAEYIRENGLEERTGLSVRQLSQSLLMSTAQPLVEAGCRLQHRNRAVHPVHQRHLPLRFHRSAVCGNHLCGGWRGLSSHRHHHGLRPERRRRHRRR